MQALKKRIKTGLSFLTLHRHIYRTLQLLASSVSTDPPSESTHNTRDPQQILTEIGRTVGALYLYALLKTTEERDPDWVINQLD